MNRTAQNIFSQVCAALEVREADVMSNTRETEVVQARYLSIYFINEKMPMVTLNTLGMWFYKLNATSPHTMAIYALKMVQKWKKSKKGFYEKWLLCKSCVVSTDIDFENIVQL